MTRPYALTILWRERHRFLPAVLAVAFSAALIALQGGLLLGLLAYSSRPIDRAGASLWVGSQGVPTIGYSHPIPEAWRDRLAAQAEIESTEPYLFGFANWHKREGGTELCYVIGSRLEEGSLGALRDLTPAMRLGLMEPGAVVVDANDAHLLGLTREVGEVAEISRRRVRVVGWVQGIKSIGMAPGVFCSLRTARLLLGSLYNRPDQTMYLLARCRDPRDVAAVRDRLRMRHPDMETLTQEEFSLRTRLHWLTKTRAGIGLGFSAVLGLFVGVVITSQTLYAATAVALREYAVLRALGIPRWRLVSLVVTQSFWIGLAGIVLAGPVIFGLRRLVSWFNLAILLPEWLCAATAVLTVAMALLAGLTALRSLRLAEPIALLR